MASFSAGTTFTDGVANDVTAAKLAALVNAATPTSGFIQDRTSESAIAADDTLLFGDFSDSNNLKRMTVANFNNVVTTGTGTAASPAIVPTGDSNTGIFFPAADTIAFSEGGAEAMRIDSSGNVLVNTTANDTGAKIEVKQAAAGTGFGVQAQGNDNAKIQLRLASGSTGVGGEISSNGGLVLSTSNTERLRIDSSGNVFVGKIVSDMDVAGSYSEQSGRGRFTTNSGLEVLTLNRQDSDGMIVEIRQANTAEGSISVSGTTVSYNGGHLSRFSQLPSGQRDPAIKKGTVLSNLDAMCEWRDADGGLLSNEQLNKVKISDVEGDSNTAGVFVNWDNDDQDNPYDLNMAMTGDMIIRIAQGTSVNRGDLLMSAGDGTAKPQGDDIIRSKTIAKVTSTNVTCTYEDGSYCVPCVLMAC